MLIPSRPAIPDLVEQERVRQLAGEQREHVVVPNPISDVDNAIAIVRLCAGRADLLVFTSTSRRRIRSAGVTSDPVPANSAEKFRYCPGCASANRFASGCSRKCILGAPAFRSLTSRIGLELKIRRRTSDTANDDIAAAAFRLRAAGELELVDPLLQPRRCERRAVERGSFLAGSTPRGASFAISSE